MYTAVANGREIAHRRSEVSAYRAVQKYLQRAVRGTGRVIESDPDSNAMLVREWDGKLAHWVAVVKV